MLKEYQIQPNNSWIPIIIIQSYKFSQLSCSTQQASTKSEDAYHTSQKWWAFKVVPRNSSSWQAVIPTWDRGYYAKWNKQNGRCLHFQNHHNLNRFAICFKQLFLVKISFAMSIKSTRLVSQIYLSMLFPSAALLVVLGFFILASNGRMFVYSD